MRAVFSAMRRSLMRLTIALASPARGARRSNRSVARTAVLAWREDSRGSNSSDVMTRAPGLRSRSRRKSEKGSRHPVSPCMEPLWVRRFDWIPADLDMVGRLFGCGRRHRDYRHEEAAFGFGAELHMTVHQREQGVIPPQADIAAGMPLGAALARQDVAGHDGFAAENL